MDARHNPTKTGDDFFTENILMISIELKAGKNDNELCIRRRAEYWAKSTCVLSLSLPPSPPGSDLDLFCVYATGGAQCYSMILATPHALLIPSLSLPPSLSSLFMSLLGVVYA